MHGAAHLFGVLLHRNVAHPASATLTTPVKGWHADCYIKLIGSMAIP
jgi:hypothetical protein